MSASMPGKERQPSVNHASRDDRRTIRGLIKTYSLPFSFESPVGLYTISRTFTPTCGAASPIPSVLPGAGARRRGR